VTIWKVDAKGRVSRVAGGRQGYAGDGGLARNARINSGDTALTADGGLLIADTWNCAVRRVWPDGRISTVAGNPKPPAQCPVNPVIPTGPPPPDGDGGPATQATLMYPKGVTEAPDGSFLVTEGNYVRRVTPDGKISTVAGSTDYRAPADSGPARGAYLNGPSDLASLPDGGFRVTDQNGAYQVSPDGQISRLMSGPAALTEAGAVYRLERRGSRLRLFSHLGAPELLVAARPRDFFDGFGDPLRLPFGERSEARVEPTTDGGLLIQSASTIEFAAPDGTNRLAVAIARESLRSQMRRVLKYRITRDASVRVSIFGTRKRYPSISASARVGLNSLRLPSHLKPGGYLAHVRATTPDGSVATNRLVVLIGSRLPLDVARQTMLSDVHSSSSSAGARQSGEYEPERWARPCKRFGPRRVDCAIGIEDVSEDFTSPCTHVSTVRLSGDGRIRVGQYRCARRGTSRYFRRKPRLRVPLHFGEPLSSMLFL
jgi:hypothetical protein